MMELPQIMVVVMVLEEVTGLEIRHIQQEDDRMAISRIYEEGWRFAYRGIVPQEYLDSIPVGGWASCIDREGVGSLVMTEDGRLIGTSSYSKSRWEQFREFGEIISIYLLPEYTGRGYGRLLLEAVAGELEKLGYRDIFLWVLAENMRARGFYEKCGFTLTEHCMEHEIGGKKLQEVQYCRLIGKTER